MKKDGGQTFFVIVLVDEINTSVTLGRFIAIGSMHDCNSPDFQKLANEFPVAP